MGCSLNVPSPRYPFSSSRMAAQTPRSGGLTRTRAVWPVANRVPNRDVSGVWTTWMLSVPTDFVHCSSPPPLNYPSSLLFGMLDPRHPCRLSCSKSGVFLTHKRRIALRLASRASTEGASRIYFTNKNSNQIGNPELQSAVAPKWAIWIRNHISKKIATNSKQMWNNLRHNSDTILDKSETY